MSHTPNLNLSYDKKGIRARGGHFPGFGRERERREEDETQELPSKVYRVPLVYFRRAKNKISSYRRGTCGYLKRRISSKIKERRFREIEVVGFRRLPTHVSTLQEVKDSSYLGLLSIIGPGKWGSLFKG